MVMNHGIIDTYLHMSNHYKLINSAKSVVNTSPPKSFVLKKKQSASRSSSRSNPSPSYSTPTLLRKNDRLPSRANSHYGYEFRAGRRNVKIHNCLQNNVPPQKYTTWDSSFLKNKQQFAKIDTKSKTSLTTNNSSARVSRESSSYSKPEIKHVSYDRAHTSKTPIPTPRKKLPSNKSMIPNYEYLQFSLRITEDIIRNDLYNPEEMQRVFNSHLEANRGRLNMTKMLQQIDHLCKELSITPNVTTESDIKSSELTFRHNSKLLLDKIANKQYEMSNEEIRNLSGPDLQNIITGILEYENKDDLNVLPKNPIQFDTLFELKDENICTDLIPLVSENNKTILITSDEIETSVRAQNVENKEITIINLEVNQLHNDLLEINKKLTEGLLNLKETIAVKDETNKTTAVKEKTIEKNEVSIKKNEITQTPFSEEIAQFLDKLPENLSNDVEVVEDKKQRLNILEKKSKDVLHFVGVTENVEIENLTETYKQINIYEPVNIEFTGFNSESGETILSSENIVANKSETNFIRTVNDLILDGMNDLFEPICKDITPNIFTGDYYKYENKNDVDDKYIKHKYRLHHENIDLYKPMTVPHKINEISLSEGEIIINAKPKRNILKVLEKYECKTCDHKSINNYKLNKFELNDSPVSIRNLKMFHPKISPVNWQECLLSDGEIKYTSSSDYDSEECKTN